MAAQDPVLPAQDPVLPARDPVLAARDPVLAAQDPISAWLSPVGGTEPLGSLNIWFACSELVPKLVYNHMFKRGFHSEGLEEG